MAGSIRADVINWCGRLFFADISPIDIPTSTDPDDNAGNVIWGLTLQAKPADYFIVAYQHRHDPHMLIIMSSLDVTPDVLPVLQDLAVDVEQAFIRELQITLSRSGVEVVVDWERTEEEGVTIRVTLTTRLFDDGISMSSFYRAYLAVQQGLIVADGMFTQLSIKEGS